MAWGVANDAHGVGTMPPALRPVTSDALVVGNVPLAVFGLGPTVVGLLVQGVGSFV
jgi:hypothetical protein